MTPGTDFPAGILFLYLLTFGTAAAGFLLPTLDSARSASDRRCQAAGRFLRTLVVAGILPPLQIILDAMNISTGLPGIWPLVVNLSFNGLIILGISASSAAWWKLVRSFSPAPFFSDRFSRPMKNLLIAVTVSVFGVQTAALLRPDPPLINLASLMLMILIVLLSLVIFDGFLRTLRKGLPMSRSDRLILRGMTPVVIGIILLHILLPYQVAAVLPPLGLMAIFIAGIFLFRNQSRVLNDDATLRDRLFDDAGLTAREREIAVMLGEGLSYKAVSEKLFVSLSTVQTHVTRIYAKLKVNSKTELSLKIAPGGPD